MNKKIGIKIADIPITFILEDSLSHQVETAYRHFLSKGQTLYSLMVSIARSVSGRPHEPEVSLKGGRLVITSEEFYGSMDLQKREGGVQILPTWPVGALTSFVKSFCTILVHSEGGLMLHAAAVVKDGKAYIFFGPAESGKSTVADLSGDYTVLTDELVAICRVNGGFRAHGTPYWRDEMKGKGGSFEIAGLFKLVKDKKAALEKLSYSMSVAALLTVPKLYRRFSSIDTILNTSLELAGVIPCYELRFLPDNSFWRCIDEHFG